MKLLSGNVYLLTNPSGNYLPEPQIAVAPKFFGPSELGYLTAGSDINGHSIAFTSRESPETWVTTMVDARRRGAEGAPVDWKWEWLTPELWETFAKEHVPDYSEMRSFMNTGYNVQMFYLVNFAEDWWYEVPSVGE